MRWQLLLPAELHFDLMNYSSENKLNPQDVVRNLIRFEVYYEQTMSLEARKAAKKALGKVKVLTNKTKKVK